MPTVADFDVGAGLPVSERVSLEAEYDTDLGPLDDPTVGRSSSLGAGFEHAVHGATIGVSHRPR